MKHFVLLMMSKKRVMSMNRFTFFPDIPPFPGVCRDKKATSQLPAFSNILVSTVDISQAGEEGAAYSGKSKRFITRSDNGATASCIH